MKVCTKCGMQIRDDAKFCDACGAQVLLPEETKSRACPNCGRYSENDVTFCSTCGTKLPVGRNGATVQNRTMHSTGMGYQRDSLNVGKPARTCPRCGRMMENAGYYCHHCQDAINNPMPVATLSVPCLLLSILCVIAIIYAPFIGSSTKYAVSLGAVLFRNLEYMVERQIMIFLLLFTVFVLNIATLCCACKKNNSAVFGSALTAGLLLLVFLVLACGGDNGKSMEYFQWGFWALLISNFIISMIAKMSEHSE